MFRIFLLLIVLNMFACTANMHLLSYYPTQTLTDASKLPIDGNIAKKHIMLVLGDAVVSIRPDISIVSRSTTTFFVEGQRSPYTNEGNINYVSVGINSKVDGLSISKVSGSLKEIGTNNIILPAKIYSASQQGCILNHMHSNEFLFNNSNIIRIRKYNDFDSIQLWTDKKTFATSCIQFVYEESEISIDINKVYELTVGVLKTLDGKENIVKVFLEPGYYHSSRSS